MTTIQASDQDLILPVIAAEIEKLRNHRRERTKTHPHPLGKRFSQEELSESVYPSYKNLLIGRTRRLPDRATLLRIADYLECSFDERQQLLNAAQYAPEFSQTEQRKQVTTLIADLSCSSTLMALEDVEEFADLLRTIWEHYDAVIMDAHGIVVKHVAARVIAVWSAEIATEDDPAQAVHAALRLRAVTNAIAQKHHIDLTLCAGLHTGMALLRRQGTNPEYEVTLRDR